MQALAALSNLVANNDPFKLKAAAPGVDALESAVAAMQAHKGSAQVQASHESDIPQRRACMRPPDTGDACSAPSTAS